MSDAMDCKHAQLAIGGEPRHLPDEVRRHIADCAACAKFCDETLAMESRLQAALELPLHRFREAGPKHAASPRRLALAASLLLAVLVGAGAWLLLPQAALASELVEHVRHEGGSWDRQRRLSPQEVGVVLARAGVQFDSSAPVVYASPCPFRGRIAPHLVIQTGQGPVTVMLLAGEKIAAREEFAEGGLAGVLLPAGEGSVAVLTRGGPVPAATEAALVSAVRWR